MWAVLAFHPSSYRFHFGGTCHTGAIKVGRGRLARHLGIYLLSEHVPLSVVLVNFESDREGHTCSLTASSDIVIDMEDSGNGKNAASSLICLRRDTTEAVEVGTLRLK